jgi:hypothetical protein
MLNRRNFLSKLGLGILSIPLVAKVAPQIEDASRDATREDRLWAAEALRKVIECSRNHSRQELFAVLDSPKTRISRLSRELWIMKRRGWPDEMLAVQYGISVKRVQSLIARHEKWRSSFDDELAELEEA